MRGIAGVKAEDHPPVPGHFDRPKAGQITVQWMQIGSWIAHIFDMVRGIEPV